MSYATIVPRGCGARKPGGLYAECGIGPDGQPLEHFLIDPPFPVPEGLDLVNKPQLWQDTEGRFGDAGVWHILIHVGAEHYPYVADYIEETRLYGASRRLPATLDLGRLTPFQSRMLMCHSGALVANFATLKPPRKCRKNIAGHDGASFIAWLDERPASSCLYKTYEVIPASAGAPLSTSEQGDHIRTVARASYVYRPSGEVVEYGPTAFFAALPISGFALIADWSGKVNEAAKKRLDDGDLPYYESPI